MKKPQYSLFDYPHVAGSKENTTSLEAAEGIEATGRAAALRTKVKDWYARGNTGTADECAEALDESILAIRPRVSELNKREILATTGVRRLSNGGRMAHVWRLK